MLVSPTLLRQHRALSTKTPSGPEVSLRSPLPREGGEVRRGGVARPLGWEAYGGVRTGAFLQTDVVESARQRTCCTELGSERRALSSEAEGRQLNRPYTKRQKNQQGA